MYVHTIDTEVYSSLSKLLRQLIHKQVPFLIEYKGRCRQDDVSGTQAARLGLIQLTRRLYILYF
jgi:hypothetical protein